jgi:hypothetical protein
MTSREAMAKPQAGFVSLALVAEQWPIEQIEQNSQSSPQGSVESSAGMHMVT